MKTLLSAALLSSLALPLFSGAALAASTGIQMLPPVQMLGATATSCLAGQGNKLLSWDGASAIKCNTGVVVTPSSLFLGTATGGGHLSLGATDAIGEGSEITLKGAGAYDQWNQDVNANNLRFFTNSNNTNQLQVFNHGAGIAGLFVEGNIGAGVYAPAAKLDIAGGVKVANDAANCTATKAGTIRWTGTAMQFCNGSAWKGMGGTVKIDYTQCVEALHDLGTGLVSYFNQWGATGAHNINLACPQDYVVVGLDHNEVTAAYCCKMKIE
ncbi:MAG TPA: hypothetical protein DCY07_07265 [Rhodospirillaceae bacterium]|nr:hypothetical protein [Rhodospirillaceae bacterium]